MGSVPVERKKARHAERPFPRSCSMFYSVPLASCSRSIALNSALRELLSNGSDVIQREYLRLPSLDMTALKASAMTVPRMGRTLVALLCAAIALLPVQASAQSHYALLRSDATWQGGTKVSATICGWVAAGESFVLQDTVIAGTAYKQLGGRGIFSSIGVPFCPPYYVAPGSGPLPYFLREDTLAGLVYEYSVDDATERLIYDYNLEVGDTIDHYFDQMDPSPTVVLGIDTVFLINGEARRRWTLLTDETDGFSHYFIEGVGSSFGIVHPFPTYVGDGPHLWCYKRDGVGELWVEDGCALPGPLGFPEPYTESGSGAPALLTLPDGRLILTATSPMEVSIQAMDGRLVVRERWVPGIPHAIRPVRPGAFAYTLHSSGRRVGTGRFIVLE